LISELKLNLKVQVTEDLSILDPVGVWLNKPVHGWKLLYKWTRDPKTKLAWHQACHDKGPTVTVVRTKDGHVFGGYAHLSWWTPTKNFYEYRQSNESFIFSLTDGKGRKPSRRFPVQSSPNAICSCDSTDGFAWGHGNDLFINPENTEKYFAKVSTYQSTGETTASDWLAGSTKDWQIVEIETFLV